MIEMQIKPVYRSLNKTLTLMGVERKLFFLLLMASFSVFQVLQALAPAVALFGVLWVFARAATQADPGLLTIVRKSRTFVSRYDPALRQKEGGHRG
jgi:type IV secretory pathway TrbD component